jgi:hypothetical protein
MWTKTQVTLALIACGALTVSSVAADPPSTLLDEVKSRTEIGAHELFIKRRKADGATLTPFTSDGCSGGLSAGWAFVSAALPAIEKHHGGRPPWENCCLVHDMAYHTGGVVDLDATGSFNARRAADEELRACVVGTGEGRADMLSAQYGLSKEEVLRLYRMIADIMYRAVRLGGAPCSGLSWRWGFGWPHCF